MSAASTTVDWKDITEKLNDPKERRNIVTKTDTEELNRLKTRNAYVKRKRKLLDQLRKNGQYKKKHTQKPSEKDDPSDSSQRSSRCSELNFSNDDAPSTPPPTLHHPASSSSAAAAADRSNRNHLTTNYSSDSDSGVIDMGDYENRIRPSSSFWRKKDGLSLAEKIIFYRNWKYRNMPKPDGINQAADDEIETALMDLRGPKRSAKSAMAVQRRNSISDDTAKHSQRPVTVIPKMKDPLILPPIDTRRQGVMTSSHVVTNDDRFPSIDKSQLVSRKSTVKEVNELRNYDVIDNRKEKITETEIDSFVRTTAKTRVTERVVNSSKENEASRKFLETPPTESEEDKKMAERKEESEANKETEKTDNESKEEQEHEDNKNEETVENKEKEQDDDQNAQNQKEPENPDEENSSDGKENKDPKNTKKKKPKNNSLWSKFRPLNIQPNALIGKLDKKVEKDLRNLQGQSLDDNDDDESDVDEETMNDLLHGDRSKELDKFLKS